MHNSSLQLKVTSPRTTLISTESAMVFMSRQSLCMSLESRITMSSNEAEPAIGHDSSSGRSWRLRLNTVLAFLSLDSIRISRFPPAFSMKKVSVSELDTDRMSLHS